MNNIRIYPENNYVNINEEEIIKINSDGFFIFGDDNKPIFSFFIDSKGTLEVRTGGGIAFYNGVAFDSPIIIEPQGKNSIKIRRVLRE